MLPNISIIIPFIENSSFFKDVICSCVNLDYPKLLYEIILVYNGYGSPPYYLEKLCNGVSIKLLTEDVKSPYAARNTGAKVGKGDILLFTDADCIVDRKWIQCMVLPFNDKHVCAIVGNVRAYNPTTALEYFGDQHIFNQNKMVFNYFRAGNGAIRRNVFERIGGFDHTFSSGGDVDLSMRLLQKGISIYFESKAIVYHRHRKTLKGLFGQYKKYGSGWRHLKSRWKKTLPMYPNIKRVLVIFVYAALSIVESLIYMFGPHTTMRKAKLYKHFYLAIINTAFIFGFYFCRNRYK